MTLLLLDHLRDLLGDLLEDLGPVLIGHLGVPSPHLLLLLDHKCVSVCVCLFLFDGGGGHIFKMGLGLAIAYPESCATPKSGMR